MESRGIVSKKGTPFHIARRARQRLPSLALSVVLCLVAVGWTVADEAPSYQGAEVEEFLAKAKIVSARERLEGVTAPRKATLELDGVTRFAVFKTIDVRKRQPQRLQSGALDADFQDSWRTEVAAYVIDRIIGLGMVPATVERRYLRDRGSVQIWVDSRMSEADRVAQNLHAPDIELWNRAMFKLRLFDNLIYNVDRHLNNLLITEDWEIVAIDHSRSFRRWRELSEPESLTRFSASLLEGLARLDEKILKERTGKYLSGVQIKGVLARRDLILQLAEERVGRFGEADVLYP